MTKKYEKNNDAPFVRTNHTNTLDALLFNFLKKDELRAFMNSTIAFC